MAIKSFRFNQFFGGISANPNFVGPGQYTDSKNIDFRTKAPLVIPSVASHADSVTTTTNLMNGGLFNFMFGDNGVVYNLNGGTITLDATITNTPDLLCGTAYGGELVILGEKSGVTRLYKYGSGTSDGEKWSGGTWAEWTPTGWASNRVTSRDNNYGIAAIGSKLYIGMGGSLIVIDENDNTTSAFEKDLDDEIYGLTVSGQMLVIYLGNGDVLFRDRFDSRDEKVSLNLPVRSVYAVGGVDYIIAGKDQDDTELYRRNGKSFELLGSYQTGLKLGHNKQGGTKMGYDNGLVYMPVVRDQTDNAGVVSWGSNNIVLPEALNFDYATSDGGYNYKNIGCVHAYASSIHISYTDTNNTTGIDKYDLDPLGSSKRDNSFIITAIFDGGARNVKKSLLEYRVHGQVGATDTITVSINTDKFYMGDADRFTIITDDHGGFTQLHAIANTDSTEQNDRYGIGVDTEFYTCQFKIDLKDGSTLSELEIFYEELD